MRTTLTGCFLLFLGFSLVRLGAGCTATSSNEQQQSEPTVGKRWPAQIAAGRSIIFFSARRPLKSGADLNLDFVVFGSTEAAAFAAGARQQEALLNDGWKVVDSTSLALSEADHRLSQVFVSLFQKQPLQVPYLSFVDYEGNHVTVQASNTRNTELASWILTALKLSLQKGGVGPVALVQRGDR